MNGFLVGRERRWEISRKIAPRKSLLFYIFFFFHFVTFTSSQTIFVNIDYPPRKKMSRESGNVLVMFALIAHSFCLWRRQKTIKARKSNTYIANRWPTLVRNPISLLSFASYSFRIWNSIPELLTVTTKTHLFSHENKTTSCNHLVYYYIMR